VMLSIKVLPLLIATTVKTFALVVAMTKETIVKTFALVMT
jgi:hypothetical protein